MEEAGLKEKGINMWEEVNMEEGVSLREVVNMEKGAPRRTGNEEDINVGGPHPRFVGE